MAKKVFTVGVFDLLHAGHLSLLKQAASFGNLTVGIISDEAVTKLKGPSRPIIKWKERADLVDSLKCVYNVVWIENFTIPDLVLTGWDIIVVGADQQHIKGISMVPTKKLKTVERPKDGNCTSEIIKRIKEN